MWIISCLEGRKDRRAITKWYEKMFECHHQFFLIFMYDYLDCDDVFMVVDICPN